MINRVVLVGRLTKDPDIKYTPSGIPMCRFTIAVNRTFTNQQGEKEADFIGCLAFRKQAENLANFMTKGSLIGVDGRIQSGSYEGNDGKRVYTTDVIADSIQFLEPRTQGRQNQQSSQGSYNSGAGNQQGNSNNQQQYGQGQQQQQSYNQQPNYNNQQSGQYSTQPQQPPTQYPNQQSQRYGTGPNNYTHVDEDPFANSRGPIEVSEDELPF